MLCRRTRTRRISPGGLRTGAGSDAPRMLSTWRSRRRWNSSMKFWQRLLELLPLHLEIYCGPILIYTLPFEYFSLLDMLSLLYCTSHVFLALHSIVDLLLVNAQVSHLTSDFLASSQWLWRIFIFCFIGPGILFKGYSSEIKKEERVVTKFINTDNRFVLGTWNDFPSIIFQE